MNYNPSYQEMGAGGQTDIDLMEYKKAMAHWLFLIDSKEDGNNISQELINDAWEKVLIEEQKFRNRREK